MSSAPWSLRRRLSLGFTLWTSVVLLLVAALGVYFIEATAQRELDELTAEELAEQRNFFARTDGSERSFGEVAEYLARLHPRFRLAWRTWDVRTGEPWGDFGETALLDDPALRELPELRAPPRTEEVGNPAYGLRLAGSRLPGERFELGILLVVDGRASLHATRRLELSVLAVALAAVLLSAVVGALFGRYVSDLLRQVARGVRRADEREAGAAGLGPLGAQPLEIRDVVDALLQLLERIRAEEAHTNLMTTGLAHELRSPVQNLIGATEVALLRDRDAETYRELLRGNLEDLRELATAIDNLVVLCATNRPRDDPEAERFDLGSELELRLRESAARAERVGVGLDLEVQGDVELRGDREALLLAVRNVVGNAIRWSPRGGRVHVELRGDERELLVQVDDQGPGIPPREREHVFEPFRRGTAHPGGRDGYGLGLALTRKAVESQGGSVEISSAPGGGARLSLRLPRSKPRKNGSAATPAEGAMTAM